MYAALDQKSARELNGLVKAALGDDWQKRTSKLMRDALDQLAYDLADYIGGELEDHLRDHIETAARRSSEAFLEALAEGREEQMRQFLQLPSPYWKQRDEHKLGSLYWSRDMGPLALRRKMIEAVQDRLEREVILDQEAEIKALRASLQKAETELRQWRVGERVYHP